MVTRYPAIDPPPVVGAVHWTLISPSEAVNRGCPGAPGSASVEPVSLLSRTSSVSQGVTGDRSQDDGGEKPNSFEATTATVYGMNAVSPVTVHPRASVTSQPGSASEGSQDDGREGPGIA